MSLSKQSISLPGGLTVTLQKQRYAKYYLSPEAHESLSTAAYRLGYIRHPTTTQGLSLYINALVTSNPEPTDYDDTREYPSPLMSDWLPNLRVAFALSLTTPTQLRLQLVANAYGIIHRNPTSIVLEALGLNYLTPLHKPPLCTSYVTQPLKPKTEIGW
jgi:hypothetical protein